MSKNVLKKKLKHLVPLAVYMAVYVTWFLIIDGIERPDSMLIEWPIDRAIPFVEAFVIPYLSWFALLPFGILLLLFQDEDAYDKLSTFLMIGMTAFLLISTFFPNHLDLRPEVLPRNNFFTMLITGLWKADTAENVWPSIHVYDSAVIVLMLLVSHARWMKKFPVRAVMVIWAFLIIIGTLFIKQHALFDHVTAWIMVGIVALLIFKFGLVFRFDRKKADPA